MTVSQFILKKPLTWLILNSTTSNNGEHFHQHDEKQKKRIANYRKYFMSFADAKGDKTRYEV